MVVCLDRGDVMNVMLWSLVIYYVCVKRDMLRSGGRNGDQTGGSKDVDTYVCVERVRDLSGMM